MDSLYPHCTNELDTELEVASEEDEDGNSNSSEEDKIIELKESTGSSSAVVGMQSSS